VLRRYDSGMNPTVLGALIAGGAALIGYGASALNTRATVRASRQTARDERFWDKKTELYEAIIAMLKAADIALYDVPLRRPNRDSLRALRRSLDERDSAIRLYASQDVAQEFLELSRSLRMLYLVADKYHDRFVNEATDQQRKLTDAMSRDLQGIRVSRSQSLRRRLRRRTTWHLQAGVRPSENRGMSE
jgi:hypothetical protein